MNQAEHKTSFWLQFGLLLTISALFGIMVVASPKASILPILFFAFLLYAWVLLRELHLILMAIILVIPFNFEGLIQFINIPFVNPFNILWISYAGVLFLRAATKNEPLFISSPLNGPLALLILFFSLSLLQSVISLPSTVIRYHIFPTFQQWIQWALFYFFCLRGLRSETTARQTLMLIMGMVFLAALLNIKDYLSMLAQTSGNSLERASGLFSNANYSASFFAYYLPISIAIALVPQQRKYYRIAALIVSMIGMIAVLVTYSRGGMMAVCLASIIMALLVNMKRQLLILLLAGFLVYSFSPTVQQRFGQTNVEGVYGKVIDSSVLARWVAWKKAFALIKEKPILGHGFFSFRYQTREAFEDDAARYHGSHAMAVHNGFLNILVNGGLVSFVLFLWVLAKSFHMAWTVFRQTKDPFWRSVGLGIMGSIIALCLVNLTGTRLFDRQMVGYFWIILAALWQGTRLIQMEKQ